MAFQAPQPDTWNAMENNLRDRDDRAGFLRRFRFLMNQRKLNLVRVNRGRFSDFNLPTTKYVRPWKTPRGWRSDEPFCPDRDFLWRALPGESGYKLDTLEDPARVEQIGSQMSTRGMEPFGNF